MTAPTPHDAAASTSPLAMASVAAWVETMEDEHAVSTARDGPRNPNTNDTRPAATLRTFPGKMKALSSVAAGLT